MIRWPPIRPIHGTGPLIAGLAMLGLAMCWETVPAKAQEQLLWPERVLTVLLNHVSGERAYEDTATLASLSRYPVSRGFHRAATIVAERARRAGLKNVRILAFPADRPSWDVLSAELWLVEPVRRKLADTDEIAVSLAMFSHNADVTAEIVDVGEGISDADYEGKPVKGKIVLASGPPAVVQQQAILARGASGIISNFSNQFFGITPSADAVSWSRLSPAHLTDEDAGFAFMISPRAGQQLRHLLRREGRLVARAHVEVDIHAPGQLEMVVGEIPGAEVDGQDIVFTAHLDHQKPGANDNASGSAVLLEIARTLNELIARGLLSPPRRTMRFWWVTEIRGTYQYFFHHPEDAKRILANINIDQAGGNRHGRNDFVAILQPPWMGTFVDDVIVHLGRWAMAHLAEVYHAPSPQFVAPTGTRRPFHMRFWPYAELTDHLVFETAGIDIPSISLAVASLEFIHTSEDSIEHIDPTQLKRSAFLGAACGWLLANVRPSDVPRWLAVIRQGGQERVGRAESRALALLAMSDAHTIHQNYRRAYYLIEQVYERESRILASVARFHEPADQDETRALLTYESKFAWNLFAQQEASVRLLREHYEALCQRLGIEPQPLQPSAEEQRLSQRIPRRTIPLGPGFREWMSFTSPQLGDELSQLVKSLIDGRRDLAEIHRAVSAWGHRVPLSALEQFVEQLVARGWVRIESK